MNPRSKIDQNQDQKQWTRGALGQVRSGALAAVLGCLTGALPALAGCGADVPVPEEHPGVGQVEAAIIGGSQALVGAGGAVRINAFGRYRCSGTLITNSWVLTSRECLRDGGQYLRDVEVQMDGQRVLTAEIIRHPHRPYDAALLRLKQPLMVNGAPSGFEMNIFPAPAPLIDSFLTCRGHGSGGPAGPAGTPREARWLPLTSVSGAFLTIDANTLGEIPSGDDWGATCVTDFNGIEQVVGVVTSCTAGSCTLLSASAIRFWIAETRVQVDLVPKNAPTQCLEVPRDDSARYSEARAAQGDCHAWPSQRWRLLPQPNFTVRIQNVATNNCIYPNATTNLIEQYQCDDMLGLSPNNVMEWKLTQSGGLQIQSVRTGKCLDLSVPGQARQAACNNTPAQRFDPKVFIDNGAHWLFQMGSQLCGEVAGASLSNGAKLQRELCTSAPSQFFRLERDPVTYGAHRIRPTHSGKCVEVPGGALGNGIPLEQNACAPDPKQRFLVEFRPEGFSYRIVSALSGKCIDTASNPGASLQTAGCTESFSQRWRLAF